MVQLKRRRWVRRDTLGGVEAVWWRGCGVVYRGMEIPAKRVDLITMWDAYETWRKGATHGEGGIRMVRYRRIDIWPGFPPLSVREITK